MGSLAGRAAVGRVAVALSLGMLLGCQPKKFDERPEHHDASAGADGGAADASAASLDATTDASALDAQTDADGHAPPDAGSDASSDADSALPDASAPVTLSIRIVDDLDDAVWVTEGSDAPLDELLHFSPDDGAATYTVEVGTDGEACRTGLRFPLPMGPGAKITRASLSLLRVGAQSTADPGSTLRVSVFESTSLPAFDHAHMHTTPSQHAPLGIWSGASVGGFHVGTSDARTVSPDLSVLVQHVIDLDGWQAGGYLGLLLTVDEMAADSYAQFRDSYASPDGPALTVSYVP